MRKVLIVFLAATLSSPVLTQDSFDFSISEAFLKKLAQDDTIQIKLKVRMDHRTNKVHRLDDDCEIHIAGTPQESFDLGSPNAIVVEPPNLCAFDPNGVLKPINNSTLINKTWPNLLDAKVMKKVCEVVGFPRIFTEHASGSAHPANPNHVFELHPSLLLTCEGERVSFETFITVFEGMRHIKPSTTKSCLENRSLRVRFNDDTKQYEFREEGGVCGNFAIVEVGFTQPSWIQEIQGGHAAIARISPDGQSRTTLKLYTFTGSNADTWLVNVKQNGLGSERKLLHGMLTYDYRSIVLALKTEQGDLSHSTQWKEVRFPLALVVYGETGKVPWIEE